MPDNQSVYLRPTLPFFSPHKLLRFELANSYRVDIVTHMVVIISLLTRTEVHIK